MDLTLLMLCEFFYPTHWKGHSPSTRVSDLLTLYFIIYFEKQKLILLKKGNKNNQIRPQTAAFKVNSV